MFLNLFAASETETTGIGALGISPKAFIVQLITFVIVFALLKKFAFTPIVKMLNERQRVIDDGVKLGQKLEKQRDKQDQEVAKILAEARVDADKIIAGAHKEAREVAREAEKTAGAKANAILAEAEERLQDEAAHARRGLEKEIAGLVSEATEAVVGEKVDSKKDKELIKKAVRSKRK